MNIAQSMYFRNVQVEAPLFWDWYFGLCGNPVPVDRCPRCGHSVGAEGFYAHKCSAPTGYVDRGTYVVFTGAVR
jgi:hypothetical protein